jgi:hypothetical protein
MKLQTTLYPRNNGIHISKILDKYQQNLLDELNTEEQNLQSHETL